MRRLNPDEVRDVVDRYQSGETMVQLATAYAIHHRTISTYLQQSGIPSRHRTMDDSKIARRIELYESGLSLVAVAEVLRIDQATVHRTLLSAEVPQRSSRAGKDVDDSSQPDEVTRQ